MQFIRAELIFTIFKIVLFNFFLSVVLTNGNEINLNVIKHLRADKLPRDVKGACLS